jgi:hypothetical protein
MMAFNRKLPYTGGVYRGSVIKYVCFTAGMALSLSSGGLSQVLITVPAMPQGMPQYYSGTNCRASVTARGDFSPSLGRTVKITRIEMWLNTTPIKWQDVPGGTTRPMLLSCMFDSTADVLQSTGFIILTCKATDEFGVVSTVSSSPCVIKNRAAMLRKPLAGSSPFPDLENRLQALNYSTSFCDDDIWNESTVVSDIENANVVWLMCHGGPDEHETGAPGNMSASRPNHAITGVIDCFYSEERRARVGDPQTNYDWPPYNFTNTPPFKPRRSGLVSVGGSRSHRIPHPEQRVR